MAFGTARYSFQSTVSDIYEPTDWLLFVRSSSGSDQCFPGVVQHENYLHEVQVHSE